ncbi:MAG TPA: membrane dipeptidase [Candidatus Krumholzibacteria bacterium]|nr:membrane dipeptidase [Candidatus Krumholzibacteria bacterium]
MRRLFQVILVVLAVALALCAALAGPLARLVDACFNRTTNTSRPPTSAAAIELHDRLFVADLHCDAVLWDRGLLTRSTRGHADLPRLQEGRVALQVFSLPNAYPLLSNYRRTPARPDVLGAAAFAHRWPRATWASPVARALHQARVFHDAVARSEGGLVVVTSASGLAEFGTQRLATPPPVGAILAVEGLHLARDDLRSIDYLFMTGVRVFGLAHMGDNAVGGSAHGWRKHGLTDFGRRVVAHIDSLGGIVDLAHASDATIADVLAMPTVPVLVSHTGVDGTCPGPRNLSDDQLARIAARGGVIGIGFWNAAVCGHDPAAIARAVRHAVRVAGIDAVALGSDFDGAVRTPFDASGMVYLTEALMAEGFDAHQIARIMGLNVLDFFLRSLPPE